MRRVVVVVVEDAESIIFTDSKVFEGSTIKFESLSCDDEDCDFREFCVSEGINPGDKCVFIKDLGKFDECPKGNSLRKVIVKLQD